MAKNPKTVKKTVTTTTTVVTEVDENWAAKPYVVLVVDESGSMAGSQIETVSAINDYLGGLKAQLPDDTDVTLIKFDSEGTKVRLDRVFNGTRLVEVRQLTTMDYTPRGMTPLHDAVGAAITEVEKRLKDRVAPVFFAVITDGGENSSREFKKDVVKAMVDKHTAEGWTFNFIGVEIDAYDAGGTLGFKASETIQVNRTTYGDSVRSMSAGVGGKLAAASTMTSAQYATSNSSGVLGSTFSDADRKKNERK